MKLIGSLAIYAALYVCVVGTAISFVAGYTGSRRFVIASRWSAYAAFGCIATASSVLMHALLTHDFSIEYVQGYSDTTMPLFYLIGAFWGGQAGSLLFWTSTVAITMVSCVYINRERYRELMPWVTGVSLMVLVCLLMILTFVSNPFEGYQIIDAPTSGKGLNPLLQTPKMVIHPPSLLAGFATMTIPFAFAAAALLSGNLSNTWVEASRKWILIPWFFLSIGNMLGGMWAYEELGWGGYWAWDPVENAAFMPWLTATALIHSLMIQERRGMLKRWNIGLMLGSFILTIFGTYITRSGLIQSVHTFAQSDIGNYFLAFLLTMTAFSVALFVWRWPAMKAERRLDSPVSKEAAFIFNNWLFLAMTVVVMFGTMWPRIKEGFFGQEVAIGPPWFNKWMAPLGLLLLLLMGIGTVISWRRANWKNFKRNFLIPIAATVIGTPATLALYWFGRGEALGVVPSPNDTTYAVMAVGLCIFVTAAIVEEFVRGTAARRRMHEESLLTAAVRLTMKQKRRYGGYLVHTGIICAFVAFAGNALKIEKDVSLKRGESATVGDYVLKYNGLSERNDLEKTLVIANIDASRGGTPLYDVHPGKAIFHAQPNMPTSEIDIHTTPLEDFYVALVNYSADGEQAAFKVFVAPFTWWFWLGGVFLIIGTFVCMWPTRESLDTLKWGPRHLARIAMVTGFLLAATSPLILLAVESYTPWGSALRYELISEYEAPSEPSVAPPQLPGDS
jgi:cytochrome c-type biogenesis protein CcmF